MHEFNCFLTLTYSDAHLPPHGSLCVRDFQLFIKRLRKHVEPLRIRFFAGGEYGDLHARPHYHALIFGYDFPDKKRGRTTDKGHVTYTSQTLEDLWGLGRTELGSVTFESAGYVASYCHKKLTGPLAELYSHVDPETGEVIERTPEFGLMSRRPGIGSTWYQSYGTDVYPRDEVIARGSPARPPRYYDRLLEKEAPLTLHDIRKERRQKLLRSDWSELEPQRLDAKAICAKAKLKLKRGAL